MRLVVGETVEVVMPKVEDTRPGMEVCVVREVNREVVDSDKGEEEGALGVVLDVEGKPGLEFGIWEGGRDVWTAGRVESAETGKGEVTRGKREPLTRLDMGVGEREEDREVERDPLVDAVENGPGGMDLVVDKSGGVALVEAEETEVEDVIKGEPEEVTNEMDEDEG